MAEKKIATDLNLLGNAIKEFAANPLAGGKLPEKAVPGAMFFCTEGGTALVSNVSNGTVEQGKYKGNGTLKENTLYLCDGDVWFPVATGGTMQEAFVFFEEYIKENALNTFTIQNGEDASQRSEDQKIGELDVPGKLNIKATGAVSVNLTTNPVNTHTNGIVITVQTEKTLKDSQKPIQSGAVKKELDSVKKALASFSFISEPTKSTFFYDPTGSIAKLSKFSVKSNLIADATPTGNLSDSNGKEISKATFSDLGAKEGSVFSGEISIPAATNTKEADYSLRITGLVGGKSFTLLRTLHAVGHIYVNGGKTFTTTGARGDATTSPLGNYTVTLNDGDFLWIAVPNSMASKFNTVMLKAQAMFAIPMESGDTATKTGYTVFRSQKTYNAATITIELQNIK